MALYSTTAAIEESVLVVTSMLSCPPLRSELHDLLYDSICDDAFTGLYILWVSQYSTVLFLFLLCIVGSVIHNFFGAFWYVNNDDVTVLEQTSKRHQAVERALGSEPYSRGNETSLHSEDDEEEDFHRTSLTTPSPTSPSGGKHSGSGSGGGYSRKEEGALQREPLELEDVRTTVL
jgi:hypothetical protein